MTLQAELSTRLNIDGVVTTLLDGVNDARSGLNTISPPAGAGQLAEAERTAGSVNTAGIDSSVSHVTEGISQLLQSIRPAQDVLGPITATLELIESVHQTDLQRQLTDLSTRLGAILDNQSDDGFMGLLVQFGNVLSSSSEGAKLKELLNRLLQVANVSLPSDALQMPDILPAIQSAVTTVGGLMSLESILAEAERLTRIMSTQFDRNAVEARRSALVASFNTSTVSLAQFVGSIDVTNPAQVRAARTAIDVCAQRSTELVDLVSQGSAFGEATLLYLDMPSLQTKVAHAADIVRTANLDSFEQSLRWLNSRLSPAITVDLSGVPVFSLETLLSSIEGRIAEISASITEFDLSSFTNPLITGIETVTNIPNMLGGAISQVSTAIQAELRRLRDAIAALPFESLGNVIRQVLQPVAQALEFIGSLVDAIKAVLSEALTALKTALSTAEGAIDSFKERVDFMFGEAAAFIDGLNLEQVLATIADNVRAFAELIDKARMKPYFDTVIGAIDTTTGIVQNVPFSLLPDSMEEEVNNAIRPVKAVDVGALETEIENLLQIGPDGKFKLRPDLEHAVADLQKKYDDLIREVRRLDPHEVAKTIDKELAKFANKIQAISPQVELAPVQEAIDRLHEIVGSFDLDAALKPLRDGFDDLLAAADRYKPGVLIAPLETRLNEARNQLIDAVKLRQWTTELDTLNERANELLAMFDPAQIQPLIRDSMREAQEFLDAFPQFQFAGGYGNLIASLLSGSGLRVDPLAFDAVLAWLQGTSGSNALRERTRRIAAAITSTHDAVQSFDPAALAATLGPQVQALRDAVARLPSGEARSSLELAVARIDIVTSLGNLAGNRERYLESLTTAHSAAESMSSTGLSEVDIKIQRLHTAFAPLAPLKQLLNDVISRLGVTGLNEGLGVALRRVFEIATPERMSGILSPVFIALHNRITALIQAVLTPLKRGVADLLAALEAVTLTPLREALDEIYQTARTEIASLHPDALLGEVVTAFNAARAQVIAFNPLADIETALTELRNTIVRVMGKLNAEEIMATPLQIYDRIMGLLGQLDLNALLTPLYDQLDNIAQQVDEGLTGTVTSFRRLQDALPATVG